MRYSWPENTEFQEVVLTPEVHECSECYRQLKICDHRFHHFFTFYGPTKLISRLKCCDNRECEMFSRTISPEEEILLTNPRWLIGWDVFAWIGFQRFSRHSSIPRICRELKEDHEIILSVDAVEQHVKRYQVILNARQQDPKFLQQEYRDVKDVVLMVDGLQPEKGHETLYVIREYRKKRVWFAESLLSSSHAEVQRFLHRVHDWVEILQKPIALWISDKQEALVQGIAKEFPETPHRYCRDHFLRDLAKPALEADSHAKVEMRKKVRGLRTIEKEVLADKTNDDAGRSIVLDYCGAVRGILNDNQGGPLTPPGLRMAKGLKEVRGSLEKNLEKEKGGACEKALSQLKDCIDRGLDAVAPLQSEVRKMTEQVKEIANTLDPSTGTKEDRQNQFKEIQRELSDEPDHRWEKHLKETMERFSPGLFSGPENEDFPWDNGELERWFRIPKGHERRIHGHRHAGVRIVQEGPTLIPVLDCHLVRTEPFSPLDLIPYRNEEPPKAQQDAVKRRKIMRRARSKKARKILLKELEKRYNDLL